MAPITRTFACPTTIPIFLAPAFARPARPSSLAPALFSRSYASKPQSLSQRPKKDNNKQRGVSAIRRTGPRVMRGLWQYPLPEPVARDHRGTTPEYEDVQNHGLWGFFNQDRKAMIVPEEEASHGRPWTYKELTTKSFGDLHKLYWVCVKEQNRSLTREKERLRVRAGYGALENEERVDTIRETMTLIREVLADRQLSYDQAQALIRQRELRDILKTEADEDDWEDLEPLDSSEAEQSTRPAPSGSA